MTKNSNTIPAEFFNDCYGSLTKLLPRVKEYETKHDPNNRYFQLRTNIKGVHFEWGFVDWNRKDGFFLVGLHFETTRSKVNQELISKFLNMRVELEEVLGERVEFDPEWRQTWARLEVRRAKSDLPSNLEEWAVEKMAILIRECEPLLTGAGQVTQDPLPPALEAVDLASPPERVATTVNRIIRDSKLARWVKFLHGYECQFVDCNRPVILPDGSRYTEAHHIQPLGQPHNGPDIVENLLNVCPHHHAELDLVAIRLSPSDLCEVNGHKVEKKYLDYHNRMWEERWGNPE